MRSESPFCLPIVVQKKDGSVRLCIDFRKLNSQTIKDAYTLPNLEEVLSVLAGSKWFSVLDLKSGSTRLRWMRPISARLPSYDLLDSGNSIECPGNHKCASTFQRLWSGVWVISTENRC